MAGESQVVFYNDLERGDPTDVQRVGKLASRDLHDILGYLSSHRSVDQTASVGVRGAVVDGLRVTAQSVPNMTVQVEVGMATIPESGTSGVVGSPVATDVDSNVRLVNKRYASAGASSVAVTAAGASMRYDLIEIGPATSSPDAVEKDEERTVDLYNTTLKRFLPSGTPRIKMRHGEGEVFYTAGTPGGSAPTPTAGRMPIAVLRVRVGATSITQQDIFDARIFLAELLDGGGQSDSYIRTGELSVDVPSDATDARVTFANLDVSVRGIRGAFRTATPFQLDITAGSIAYNSFLDPNFSDFASYTGWVYFWLVVTDDNGIRYSRASCTTEVDVGGSEFAHVGALVVSKIAPVLTNGSLAPAAALKTPNRTGNATCTPGTGRAVCLGAMWWQSSKFQHGMRKLGAHATFSEDDGLLPACFFGAWTHVSAGGAGTTQTSTFQADLTLASNPKGPVSLDVWAQLTMNQPTPKNCVQRYRAWEFKATDASPSKLLNVLETNGPVESASSFQRHMLWRGLPVSRISTRRDSSTNGVKVQFDSVSGTSHSTEFASGTPPTTKLLGYAWPEGPVVA